MFLDLTDCTIINEEMDRDEDVQKHLLSSGMWAIVRPGTTPPCTRTDDDDHFDSKISKHFKIVIRLRLIQTISKKKTKNLLLFMFFFFFFS